MEKKLFFEKLQTLRLKFLENKGRVKVLQGFTWLLFDKAIQIVVTLFITAWMARYFGVEKFGMWNYALAYIGILSAFSTLGLDTIVIRDIVKKPSHEYQILGSTFLIKITFAILSLVLSIVGIFYLSKDPQIRFMVSIMALSFLCRPFDIIEFYFQSKLHFQYIVLARNIAFLIVSAARIILIINKAPLIFFAWSFLCEVVFGAVLLIVFYKIKEGLFRKWSINQSVIVQLIKDGWPLFLSFTSSMLYLRCDQIMVGKMLDNQSLGLYSASLRIYEVPFMISCMLASAIFPKIVELYETNIELFARSSPSSDTFQ